MTPADLLIYWNTKRDNSAGNCYVRKIEMKIITSSALLLAVMAVLTLICGCEEQGLRSERKTRLVGDENLRLKKQLELRDREIQKLEEVMAEYEKEEQKRADAEADSGNLALKLLKDSAAATKETEKLSAENLQLKARIAELESELAQSGDQPDSQ